MADGSYPYTDLVRALEQNGWLKSEIERKVDKTDLFKVEASLKEYSNKLEESRLVKTQDALNAWWAHEKPAIAEMIKEAIKTDRDQREAVRQAVLAEQGLEISPDGRVKSKIHPAKAWAIKNWFGVVAIVAAVAIAKPEMTFSAARWLTELFL